MPKLKTYGVITEDEYKQGNFLIASNVTCSYCDQPVSVSENPEYLYCPQHYQLALSMVMYPGYPAIPRDTPRYKEMHFFFSQLARNLPLFDRQKPEYLVREKGCPFCDRYLLPVDPRRDGQIDTSLLNQTLFCPDCGVAFLIEVIAPTGRQDEGLQMHFTPDTDAHTPQTHTASQPQTTQTHTGNRDTETHTHAKKNETTPAAPVGSTTDTPPKKNAPKDIEGQILALLPKDGTAMRPKEILANINGNRKNMYEALKRLEKDGHIKNVERGWYARAV